MNKLSFWFGELRTECEECLELRGEILRGNQRKWVGLGEIDPVKKSEGAVGIEDPRVWWMETRGGGTSGGVDTL